MKVVYYSVDKIGGLRIELRKLKKVQVKCGLFAESMEFYSAVFRNHVCYEEENGNRVYEVRDFPKTEAGIRNVVIPSNS